MRQVLPLYVVNHRDIRIYLDDSAVEHGRRVSPLTHSLQRGLKEQRITSYNLQGLNRAVGRDNSAQLHTAGPPKLSWKGWIDRLDATREHRRVDMRHVNDMWLLDFDLLRWYRRSISPIGNRYDSLSYRAVSNAREAIAVKYDYRPIFTIRDFGIEPNPNPMPSRL